MADNFDLRKFLAENKLNENNDNEPTYKKRGFESEEEYNQELRTKMGKLMDMIKSNPEVLRDLIKSNPEFLNIFPELKDM